MAANKVEGCFFTEAAERGPACLHADRGAVCQGVIDPGHQLDAEDVLAHRHINEGDRAGGCLFCFVGPVGVEGDLQVLHLRLADEHAPVVQVGAGPADSGACVWRPARVVHEVVVRVGEDLVGVVASDLLVRRFLAAPLGVFVLLHRVRCRADRRPVAAVVPVEVLHFEAQRPGHISDAEATCEAAAGLELVDADRRSRGVVEAGRVRGDGGRDQE